MFRYNINQPKEEDGEIIAVIDTGKELLTMRGRMVKLELFSDITTFISKNMMDEIGMGKIIGWWKAEDKDG